MTIIYYVAFGNLVYGYNNTWPMMCILEIA